MDIRSYTVPDALGRDTRDLAAGKVQAILDDIRHRGIFYIGRRDCVTGYGDTEFYDWDLYFEMLFLSYFGVSEYCLNNVETFLDTQLPTGFVSRTLREPRPRQHFKPFLAQTALLGSRQNRDFRWLCGKYYERLQKYLDYWFWYRDADKNGLCYWDGSDESGMDNQARRLGHMDICEYEGVDLNCYLARELDAMAQIAGEMGLHQDEEAYRRHSARLKALIEAAFWNEKDGFYYDRSEKTGQLNPVLSVAGFMPLWCGAASPERADRLIREHLTNPDEFWLSYPVATWSKSEPDYYQMKRDMCNWMGATWIPTNYMVFRGLVDYGYTDVARSLAEKTFELVVSQPHLCEFYNGETGAGQGRAPFWGWSSLGYVMLAELLGGFSHSDLDAREFHTFDGFHFSRW